MKTPKVNCAEHRDLMRLLSLRKRLASRGDQERDRAALELEIRELEKKLGLS